MKIKIVAIGKVKEKYLKEGINEYLTRISPFADISIVEVNDQPIKDNPNDSDIKKAIDLEGRSALKYISNNEYVIALDLNKKEMDSVEFSNYLIKKLEVGGSSITFVIGGSYGLSDELKSRVNDSISLSKMTFLHQMTRLILLEQIYRAFKIHNHQTYHK
ncbi:MAG: 23S rRNA (pseudouridine(1915)-N(3))-methyltransferase RlmH [Bacilli bacterium]|nr:23S rRNA (pseudouridine(1915)-N(3))-methyltransferase RlmH [Bacilli bacterium]